MIAIGIRLDERIREHDVRGGPAMHATRLSGPVLTVTGDYAQEHIAVVAAGDGLAVIDTLATLPATRAALPLVREFSGEPVRIVVSTHLDVDHAAGNHLFAGAALVAHANGTRHLDERVFDSPESEQQIRALITQLRASDVPADPVLPARRQTCIDMHTSLLDGFGDFTAAPPLETRDLTPFPRADAPGRRDAGGLDAEPVVGRWNGRANRPYERSPKAARAPRRRAGNMTRGRRQLLLPVAADSTLMHHSSGGARVPRSVW
jgi:hypothetical protein